MLPDRYIITSLGLDEDVDLEQVMIPATIVTRLMDGYKKEIIFKIETTVVEESPSFVFDRCPSCGSLNIEKLDEDYDTCVNCHAEWRVQEND